jgi:hypothetical protein
MKANGGGDVYIHIFLTSAVVWGVWLASRPGRFIPGEIASDTNWIGGWINPRAGLDDMKKWKFLTLPGLELRPLGRPTSSQVMYRLRYPGCLKQTYDYKIVSRNSAIYLVSVHLCRRKL